MRVLCYLFFHLTAFCPYSDAYGSKREREREEANLSHAVCMLSQCLHFPLSSPFVSVYTFSFSVVGFWGIFFFVLEFDWFGCYHFNSVGFFEGGVGSG